VGVLALQGFLLLVLTTASLGVTLGVSEALAGTGEAHIRGALADQWRREPEWFSLDGLLLGVGVLVTGVGAGVWLRTGLAHWRWWLAWPAWALALVVIALLPEVAHAVDTAHARLAGVPAPSWTLHEIPRTLRVDLAILLAVLAAATMPIGGAGHWAWRRSRVGAWRRLLRRRRGERGRG
jgi:hypothetical protein